MPAAPQIQQTGKFSVFDRPGVKQHARTSGGRLTKASDGKIEQAEGVHIGGAFTPEPKPAFTAHRESVWDAAAARRAAQPAPEKKPITITKMITPILNITMALVLFLLSLIPI